MDKKQAALERLDSLENEAKELRKIINAPDKPKSIMERVKTFEDICLIEGTTVADFQAQCDNKIDSKDERAYKKLKLIAKVLNEGWKPDWSNGNENKYYPYFRMSGFGFSATYCGWARTGTTGGSRLCFKTRELAEYAGKQFEMIYKDYLL